MNAEYMIDGNYIVVGDFCLYSKMLDELLYSQIVKEFTEYYVVLVFKSKIPIVTMNEVESHKFKILKSNDEASALLQLTMFNSVLSKHYELRNLK